MWCRLRPVCVGGIIIMDGLSHNEEAMMMIPHAFCGHRRFDDRARNPTPSRPRNIEAQPVPPLPAPCDGFTPIDITSGLWESIETAAHIPRLSHTERRLSLVARPRRRGVAGGVVRCACVRSSSTDLTHTGRATLSRDGRVEGVSSPKSGRPIIWAGRSGRESMNRWSVVGGRWERGFHEPSYLAWAYSV
jgi:hypothetical protein